MLTERQELILKTIIQDFTKMHEPVGSKTVMNQLSIKVSSATIRNEMAVLEEHGLIEKTHSSSGRVPSTEGYRYYLDNLVQPLQLPEEMYNQIGYQFDQPFNQVDEIVKEAAKILSDLTDYTAFAEGPEAKNVSITGFRIVPLAPRQVMAILVTSDGSVKNQLYTLPRHISGDEVERAVRLINDQLVGKNLSEINKQTFEQLSSSQLVGKNAPEFLELLEAVIKDATSEQMYVDGQLNLLNNTENSDLKAIKSLYELINSSSLAGELIDLSDSPSHYPVYVRLGAELENDLLKDFSLVMAEYSVGRYGRGAIALLGPRHMPYSEMIGLMEYFSQELARKLLDYYGRFK
ncbi:heat-inducible transcriptional repressor HrcA [Lactobacillus delbrueckii]|uniref:Heat-inducible transcription repressor HrcA n=1 Tax=Lactobacillus delbrueckii subsp. lactis TaxID=29397 RepID=A0ABD4SGF4_LACDL|nr:heat-inducible transcriptional repressor HrcA [Lactobacillus delbrueckii]EPB98726.1 heat-inducible transcription repressor HrcA [Lactobacillus delbrueckii subsp. lactis CRL581]MCD5434275.1 heat-inducible transcriptional repressor HrcA [Lactobacillus delbrueckii subsp. lactis]MCD5561129.1 heat-inducible transcriptional repressor HrcA [Lactobacillus delbrueckii subsp. lactis]MCD5562996.1 heat-inducible transcriptional repressor HrcA [Lactobacillus delbrueckii subsp. lactis]